MQSQHLVAKNIFAEKIARTPSQVPYQDLTALGTQHSAFQETQQKLP